MARVIALLAGLLFGAGLTLSGMVDPLQVRGFLDLFGHWDPSLAFVMGGAMLPMALAWRLRARMGKPLASASFVLPETRPAFAPSRIDAVFGSLKHAGPTLSIDDMDAAIATEAKRRARD